MVDDMVASNQVNSSSSSSPFSLYFSSTTTKCNCINRSCTKRMSTQITLWSSNMLEIASEQQMSTSQRYSWVDTTLATRTTDVPTLCTCKVSIYNNLLSFSFEWSNTHIHSQFAQILHHHMQRCINTGCCQNNLEDTHTLNQGRYLNCM